MFYWVREWGKAGGSCLRHLGRRSSRVSSDELESLGFVRETDRELEGEGLGTCVCGTGCVVTARDCFLSLLSQKAMV